MKIRFNSFKDLANLDDQGKLVVDGVIPVSEEEYEFYRSMLIPPEMLGIRGIDPIDFTGKHAEKEKPKFDVEEYKKKPLMFRGIPLKVNVKA